MVKTIVAFIIWSFLLASLLLLDVFAFETFNQLLIQAALCAYIITLVNKPHALIMSSFVMLLGLESLIFFGHVSYGLFIALFLIPLAWVLKAWIEHPLLASISILSCALGLQETMVLTHHSTNTLHILMLIGHFCTNTVFLSIYWFFDKNGKLGNRS